MLPDLKIQPLRYVLAIVEAGSVHAAAQRLHRTQPALTMAVRDLDSKLGQPLFEKGSKARLTPYGEYCLPRFQDLVNRHDLLVNELTTHAEGRTGRVTLATVPSVATRLMPDTLAAFIAEYPRLDVTLHDENAEFVCRMVANREVDLGISSIWEADEQLHYTHLFEDKVGVVCRRDHPLANGDEVSWRDLSNERFIRNGTSRLLDNTLMANLAEASAFYISNMISLIAMLEAGAGITTLPQLAFPQGNQTLRFIPLSEPVLIRRIGIITPADSRLSPAAEALKHFMATRLKADSLAPD